ncbi:MAG TPA: serine/threonine-protein kinase, partial [Thauera aminoaromatica]|nr:serine/threonine-protein kinase [Thauera aminoaromatica]
MAGAVLGGRFEVEKRIGRGGMAEVFLSKDLLLHGLAAVKVLREGNTDARRRFADEGRLLANLRDPHLVRVLAVGETEDGAPYMALEYLDGPSLEGRLRGGPLPWREVVDLAGQVAGALAALHRVGVIHRDVKPSNIVQLDGATGRPVAKLIDLGIAKVLDWSRVQGGGFTTSWRRKTEIGQVVGTHGFYPPEAALTEADPRYDTYGLGVTIYQLCTGVLPVPGEYRPMRELAPKAGIPAELEALVEAAVAVLPEDRVASAEEFARRLEAIRVAHADEATPHLFDGCYELLEVIGAGAKAEVYRAYHRDAGRYVALKLLSVKAQAKPEERLRFAREARVMGAVRHAALPELVECRTSAKRAQPYISMSLVKGKRAGEFCIAGKTLAAAEVVAAGRMLAGALVALHERGVLHRDINSSNVLIDRGRETTATLIDVGMAELTDKFYAVVEQRYPTPPEERRALGTGGLEGLEWTAPEARAGKGWTAKSDVFSLGLLLYKMLTGKRPFAGEAVEMVPPRVLGVACPRALERALRRALEHDPERRCDAQGLVDQLDEAVLEMEEEALDDAADDKVSEAPSGRSSSRGQADMTLGANARAAGSAEAAGAGTVSRAEGAAETATTMVAEAGGVSAAPSMTSRVPQADVEAPQPWRLRALQAGMMAAVAVLAWWGGRATAPGSRIGGDVVVVAAEEPRAEEQPMDLEAKADVIAVAVAEPMTAELMPMTAAIESASPSLRRCAGLAGETLVVNFSAARGRDRFEAVTVLGGHDDEVERCVREAGAAIRFAPATSQSM